VKLPRWLRARMLALSLLVLSLLVISLLVISLPQALRAGSKDKEKEPQGHRVDSGAFGVFMGGRRVGTETFSIDQNANGSVIQSEFKTEGASAPAAQKSELQLTVSGEIKRYEWRELSPGKAQAVVLPSEQFLTQKWSANPDDKPQEQVFLLSAATSILDDYFFVHREVLAWRYLASACKQEQGQVQCRVKQRVQFGSLNPRQRASAPITMEFLGREKVALHGSERELNKLELKSEGGNWELWLDDQFKVLRIYIVGENTEVVRD
jgi:hypothetical protein